MKKGTLAFGAIALASALVISGCSAADDGNGTETPQFEEGTTMAKLAEQGSIKIGTKFDQPLFGEVGPSGTPEGFDVEIGKLIAKELGISADKIQWVETVSANRETFIQNGTTDIVIATYTINDKRKESISFAGPYYLAGQSILTTKENPAGIQSDADLVGKQVCSVDGSTPAAKLAEIGAIPVLFKTYAECIDPLKLGQVDAVSTDNVILAGFAAKDDTLQVVGTPFTDEPYGIGVGHDDDAFRSFINDVLEKIYANGDYRAAWDATAGKVLPYVNPPAVNRYSN